MRPPLNQVFAEHATESQLATVRMDAVPHHSHKLWDDIRARPPLAKQIGLLKEERRTLGLLTTTVFPAIHTLPDGDRLDVITLSQLIYTENKVINTEQRNLAKQLLARLQS